VNTFYCVKKSSDYLKMGNSSSSSICQENSQSSWGKEISQMAEQIVDAFDSKNDREDVKEGKQTEGTDSKVENDDSSGFCMIQ
jgi:hypothetical protein